MSPIKAVASDPPGEQGEQDAGYSPETVCLPPSIIPLRRIKALRFQCERRHGSKGRHGPLDGQQEDPEGWQPMEGNPLNVGEANHA